MSVPENVVLEKCIKDILTQIKPVEDDRNKRLSVILELENCVHSVTALQGAAVKPFGSFLSDLYSKSGDLDLSIQLWSGSNLPINKKRKQNVLNDVRRALLTRGVARNMQFIPRARVPVLQYVSNRFGISCDISIENNAGQIKSKIFYWVNSLDDRFGDMVLLIKEWAKAQNINDPKTGSLNSYSLCLLVLFHFQTTQPPILPPLKEIYEGNIREDTTEVASYNEEQINEVCAANIARIRLQSKGPKNGSSLCHLLATFFHKFIHIDAHPDEVISTYTGQLERTEENPCRMKKSYHLFVEDPVERPDNAARAVSMKGLQRIANALNDAHRKLHSAEHVDRNELLALLCTPGVGAKLGGRVVANSYRNAPQRSPQQIRSLGRGKRDQRFGEVSFTGTRPVQRNQQADSSAHQTEAQANRVRERAARYENHNHPQAYMTGHQGASYQNHYQPQAYVTGYRASPYQNHYHPQVHPAEPNQNHNIGARTYQSPGQVHTQVLPTAGTYQNHYRPQAYVTGYQASPYQNHYHPQVHPAEPHQNHNIGARPYQSPGQVHTQVLPTAGAYQNRSQQVYYPESQAAGAGLYQNQPRRNGYTTNHQAHRHARTAKYQPAGGQFDNGSIRESRSQASNSGPSQR